MSPESLESWNIILRAVEILYHQAALDLAKETDCSIVPDIKYQRCCCSIFTLKKTLDSLSCEAGSSSGSYS